MFRSPPCRLLCGFARNGIFRECCKHRELFSFFLLYIVYHLLYNKDMETIATNIRIDRQLKEQSSEILEGLGLSLSGAINMFLRQVILQDGIPFKVEYPKPSRSLRKAIKEGEKLANDPNAKGYKNFQELLDELGIKE